MKFQLNNYFNNKKLFASTVVAVLVIGFSFQFLAVNNLLGEDKDKKVEKKEKIEEKQSEDKKSTPKARLFYLDDNKPDISYTKLDPFQEMRRMQEAMDHLFNQTFNRFERSPDFKAITQDDMIFSPRIDIKEDGKNYVVKMDLPGVTREEIKVKLVNRFLTISGKREEKVEEKSEKMLKMERRLGSFSRTFSLPGPVDQKKIKAVCKDGVLTVTLPKKEKEKEEVEIKVEEQ